MKSLNHCTKTLKLILSLLSISLALPYGDTFAQNKEADSVFVLAQNHYERGRNLLSRGEKSLALRQFSKAADLFGDHQDYMRSKLDSVKPIYESFLAREPKSALFNYLMGRWYSSAQRDSTGQSKAISFYQAALRMEPQFVWPYHGLARLSTGKGDYDAAERYYQKAIELDSTFDIGYLYLASTYERMGKQEQALRVRKDLLRRDSTSYGATFAMLYIARGSKELPVKEEMYKKAIRLTEVPWLREGAYQELMREMIGEKPDSAESLARRVLSANLSSDIYTCQTAHLTIFYVYQRSKRDKIASYAKTLLGERDPLLLGQIGAFCLDSLKELPIALQCLDAAYKVCTRENVLGTIAHGQFPEERLVQIAQDYRNGYLALKLGEVNLQMKKYDAAERYFRESVDYGVKKSLPLALYELGYTLIEKGNMEEAVKWLTQGLAIKHDDKAMATLEKLLAASAGKQAAAEKIAAERRKSAQPAPDFKLATLKGDTVRLSGLKGKVVMIDFWATWCGPCVSELPNLAKLYEKYSKNTNVFFLSIDTNEPAPAIKPFMEKNGYSFTVLLGNETSVPRQYGVEAIPTKFLIDKVGKIQFKHIGGGPDAKVIEELSKEIEELVAMQ